MPNEVAWRKTDIAYFRQQVALHRRVCGPTCYSGDYMAAIIAKAEAEG